MKILSLMFVCCSFLAAADLPKWAKESMADAAAATAPEFGTWVLLDETQISLLRNGRFRKQRRVVKKVISGGASDAAVYIVDGDAETTRIKKLKGWHLSKGKVERLDKNNVLAMGSFDTVSTDLKTFAFFRNVGVGSVVAFESDEVIESYFSRFPLEVLSSSPILKRVVVMKDMGRGKLTLLPQNFEEWHLSYQLQGNRLEIQQLPGLPSEPLSPDFADPYPRVIVGFTDKEGDDHLDSWDHMARWYYQLFAAKAWPATATPSQGATTLEAVARAAKEVHEKISYRQVYLSAARGWEPLAAKEVSRLAYGDCKDMVSYFTGQLRQEQLASFPALASIGDGMRIGPQDIAQAGFNHVIAAVLLETSLGLPAEVEAGGRRYLLHDTTDTVTPLGYMSSAYEDRSVFICTPEGAQWVAVPAASLAMGDVAFGFSGELDASLAFTGMLTITERGNALGLHGSTLEGNPQVLDDAVRTYLDIPASALLISAGDHQEEGSHIFSYQLQWPMFLTPDLGGNRLGYGVTGSPLRDLQAAGKERVCPIYRARVLSKTVTIELQSEQALFPGAQKQEYEDAHGSFSWTAEGGKIIRIQFVKQGAPVYYARAQRPQAAQWWKTYRHAVNNYLATGPVFFKEAQPTL